MTLLKVLYETEAVNCFLRRLTCTQASTAIKKCFFCRVPCSKVNIGNREKESPLLN